MATAENQAGQGHFGLDLDGFLFAGQLGCCDSREIIERQSVCVVDVARRGEAENSSVVARKEEERNNNNNGSSNNNSNTHTQQQQQQQAEEEKRRISVSISRSGR